MLNIFGPANYLGVGIHCYHLAKAYTDLGNDVCLVTPFGNVSRTDEYVERWLKNRDHFSANDPSLMIFDIQFLTQFSGTPRIGFAVFETDGFTPAQLAAMKSCDYLLTPSAWGQRVLGNHGLVSSVVNEGIDPVAFPLAEPRKDGIFRFLHVGKTEERKGTLQIVKCFFEALEKEDAELVLHCDNPFVLDGGRSAITTILMERGFRQVVDGYVRAGLRVTLTSHMEDMAGLYASADCGVFPSRGEGWGLPIHECIATGVPTIVGVWSGQSEFLGKDYPAELTLEKSRLEVAYDGVWFHGDRGNWRVPEDAELVIKMRWAFKYARTFRQTEAWGKVVEGARAITWQRAAEQLDSFLSQVT